MSSTWPYPINGDMAGNHLMYAHIVAGATTIQAPARVQCRMTSSIAAPPTYFTHARTTKRVGTAASRDVFDSLPSGCFGDKNSSTAGWHWSHQTFGLAVLGRARRATARSTDKPCGLEPTMRRT